MRCRRCNRMCNGRADLYVHQMTQHGSNESLQPFQHVFEDNDQTLRDTYDSNRSHILANHRNVADGTVYNYPIQGLGDAANDTVADHVDQIERNEDNAFKVNLALGMILKHATENRYRYYIPYRNNLVLETPFIISGRKDIDKLKRELAKIDLADYVLKHRPNTKWLPYLVTNISYYVTPLNYPLGRGQVPDYVRHAKSVVSLDKNRKGEVYEDNLCAFRSLACHLDQSNHPKADSVYTLYNQWCRFSGKSVHRSRFSGIHIAQIPDFEICFNINVNVYELQADRTTIPRYRSLCNYADTLYLNVHESHLSYIKDFNQYAKKWSCPLCSRHFEKLFNWQSHLKICSNSTCYRYPGGIMKRYETIFNELSAIGIKIPDSEQFYPFFIVFDFEAMLEKIKIQTSEKLVWTQKHHPISVSICSNVESFTQPKCFVNPDMTALVTDMLDYMITIADAASTHARAKWRYVFEQLDALRQQYKSSNDDDSDCMMENDDDPHRFVRQSIQNVCKKFERYCDQVPVLSFNGAKYDLNLIKGCLAKCLNLHEEESEGFVVKKMNSYVAITTKQFRFLDVSQYLAGSSYVQFLKAFEATVEKGFFCYDYFDSFAKLDDTSLPPYEAFYSELKSQNVLDENGKGIENHNFLKSVWQQEGMRTFQDFLIWYNNRDCIGFVEAVENMLKFYRSRNIDMFKDSISVPGIARTLLFRSTGAKFPLFDSAHQDLYKSISASAIGGPSIVFNRYMNAGESRIRNNPRNICQHILGEDMNSLYLYCLSLDYPTGIYVDYKKQTNFKPEPAHKFMSMYFWLDYLAEKHRINIKHRLNNNNSEVRVGPYPVDGHCLQTKTVYEFQGCRFHPHETCELIKPSQNESYLQKERANRTKEKREYLIKNGYSVVEIQECTYKRDVEPNITHIIDSYLPQFYRRYKSAKINEDMIQRAVCANEFFGILEVDIEVPVSWRIDRDRRFILNDQVPFRHSMTPEEYFAEMSPIFCTAEIPFDAIGEHMQNYVTTNELSTAPRKLLVGGMRAEKLMLNSPLVKWYLEHGLVISKIHRLVEFTPQKCFRSFVNMVTEARRQGDIDKSKSIIADTSKLWGNSAYGSVLMNKEKHREIIYVKGRREMQLAVNEPRFRRVTHLGDDMYEIERSKKIITFDIPNYLGFFVLNYGKLHMLRYYYDCLDYYAKRECFELTQIDTDSMYFAISESSFTDIVKADKLDEYQARIEQQCHLDAIEADGKNWYQRTCCDKHRQYDRRTPGLMKLEASGCKMISLCSKTYFLQCKDHTKLSCKGLNKINVKDPGDIFFDVLHKQAARSGNNMGFRVVDNAMFTYKQERASFSYFYCKRLVLNDGIRTKPLSIILNPMRNTDVCFVDASSVLSNYHPSTLYINLGQSGPVFQSAHHLFLYLKALKHDKAETALAIQSCSSVHDLYVRNFKISSCNQWLEIREQTMEEILFVKWLFCPEFRTQLSKQQEIVVCGLDRIWSCGLKLSLARVTKPSQYPGQNLLGKLLMRLSSIVKHVTYDYVIDELKTLPTDDLILC